AATPDAPRPTPAPRSPSASMMSTSSGSTPHRTRATTGAAPTTGSPSRARWPGLRLTERGPTSSSAPRRTSSPPSPRIAWPAASASRSSSRCATCGPRASSPHAGAHGPANGLDAVLDAAALLRDHAIRIVLVGDGPAKAGLQTRATREQLPNVEFRDPVPKAAMPDLLASAHAGLMVLRDAPLFAFGVSPNKLFD